MLPPSATPDERTPKVKSLFAPFLLLTPVEREAPGLAGLLGAVPGLYSSPGPEECLTLELL